MSTRITLACGAPVLDDLYDAIALDDVRSDVGGEGLVPGLYRFHREGVSTRFTEVKVTDGAVAVRMFSLASPEDVALAMQIVRGVAELGGVREANAEMLGLTPIADIVAHHDAAWADAQVRSGLGVLRAMIEDGRGPMEIPGARRSYFVGPRVLAELAETGDEDTAHRRLLSQIRRVQWMPVRTAGTFIAKRAEGEEVKLAVLMGDEVVFPAVRYAAVSRELDDGARDVVLVDSSHVPRLAGARWTYLDERQGHLRDFGADWPAVVEAARAVSTTL